MPIGFRRGAKTIADSTDVDIDNSAYAWIPIANIPRSCRIRQVSFFIGTKDASATSVSFMLAEDDADTKYLLNHGLADLSQTLEGDTTPVRINIPLDLFYEAMKDWSDEATGRIVTLYVGIKTDSATACVVPTWSVMIHMDINGGD